MDCSSAVPGTAERGDPAVKAVRETRAVLEKVSPGAPWWRGLSVVPALGANATDLIAATLAINIVSLAVPIMMMQVFDRIIPNQAASTLVWLAIGCLTAIFLDAALRWARGLMTAWMGARFEHLCACEAIDRVLGARIEAFEKDGIGVHLDRLGAINNLKTFYVAQVFQGMLDLPFAVLFFLITAFVGGWLVAIPLSVAILLLVVFALARRRLGQARRREYTINDRRYNFIIETLSGIHLIKAQTMEEQMLRRYERLQAAGAETSLSVNFWSMLPTNIGASINQLTTFAILGLGAAAVIEGSISVGALTASTMLASRALAPIKSLAGIWFRYSDTQIARERVGEIARLPQECETALPPFPDEIDGGVELQNVSFRYGEDQPWILEDVTMRFPPGRIVAFVGPGSAGTTTLFQLMAGKLKPDAGDIHIDDHDLARFDTSDLKGRIEYLPSNGTLFKGTILDNIAMFDPVRRGAALTAAAMLDLDDPIGLLPKGYETEVDAQSANFLPTGLVQRICLARMLVTRPRILLFDKTSSSMDQESEAVFLWLLRKLAGRCTILMAVTHAGQADVADEIVLLSRGKLAWADVHEGRVVALPAGEVPPERRAVAWKAPVNSLPAPAAGDGESHASDAAIRDARWARWLLQTGRRWSDVADLIEPTELEPIDAPYRHLIELTLSLIDVLDVAAHRHLSLKDITHQSATLDQLYASAHSLFGEEERIIDYFGLPMAEEQTRQHAAFLADLKSHIDDFKEGRLTASGSFKRWILEWLVSHGNDVNRASFRYDSWDSRALSRARSWEDVIVITHFTGIEDIDGEHRQIIEGILGLAGEVAREAAPLRTGPAFDGLLAFIDRHCRHEEMIVWHYGLPERERQVREHEEARAMLRRWKDEVQAGKPAAADLMKGRLLSWWLRHMNDVDGASFAPAALGQTVFAQAERWFDLDPYVYLTGRAAHDETHRTIGEYIIGLRRIIGQPLPLDELLTAFDQLHEMMSAHFAAEEADFDQGDELSRRLHLDDHAALLSLVRNMHEDFRFGRLGMSEPLRRRVLEHWIGHINQFDYQAFRGGSR